MIAALRELCDRMGDAHRRGSSLVLLFDYDGTLTPIVEHPRLAVLDRKTRRLLACLAARPRVRLGVLSGRELGELQSLLPAAGLYLAGAGGLEVDLRGLRIAHPESDRTAEVMNRIAQRLEADVATYRGAWIENKRLGLTIHYRRLPGRLLASLQEAVAEITRQYAGQVRIVQGPRAWEITTADGWTKGTAVRLILADLGADRDVLFYAGDGANDAEAFDELAAMGGVTVGIGPDAPKTAAYRMPNQAALIDFLTELDARLEAAALAPSPYPIK